MNKILIVGQTPPPFGGQAIMIKKILNGKYDSLKLFHVRMAFSKEMNDMGKIQLFKIIHLFQLILKIYYFRIVKGVRVLYYPPSGPDKIAVYRDMFILITTRWLFKKTIFHFHAGGISQLWDKLHFLEKVAFRLAFFKPDISISLSNLLPPDAEFLQSKEKVVIPYGIEDFYDKSLRKEKDTKSIKILFIGVLRETKGEFVLLESSRIMSEKGLDFSVDFVGKFYTKKIKQQFFNFIDENNLNDKVKYLGVRTGIEKNEVLANADIFCFPSFFESETFGLVLVEAMQFYLPLIGTNWRGIPDNIIDGSNGFLVNIKDPVILADKIEKLILNDELRLKMGKMSRKLYEEKYTIEKFYENLNACFASL